MKTNTVARGRKTAQILLIEDNPGDIVLVQEALRENGSGIRLDVVTNVDEAMDYLYRRNHYEDVSKPGLIILDVNLPKKNGLELLQEIKNEPGLKDIPVVVFTTSRSDKDILKTYGLGGACLITKPLGFYEYMECVKSITSGLMA